MELERMEELFDQYSDEDEYLKFEKVENKLSQRSDLHAFILFDKLMPVSKSDIIGSSEHDEFYLSIEPEEFAKVATDENILELVRCGVMYNSSYDSFSMFS